MNAPITSSTATTEAEWIQALTEELDETVTRYTDHDTHFWVATLHDNIRLTRIDTSLFIEDPYFTFEDEINITDPIAESARDQAIAYIREHLI